MPRVIVIGAANVDVTARTLKPFRPYDSNPSHVHISFGGVGRNIAHNLRLMGVRVRFVTVFGEDAMSRALHDDCKKLGMLLDPLYSVTDGRSNYFVCINNEHGEMVAGAADTSLLDYLGPETLGALHLRSNAAAAVVADCNVRGDTLSDLSRSHCGLMYVDATSVEKSRKINDILMVPHTAKVVVKANRLEAQHICRKEADAATLAEHIIGLGAERVYITLGPEGVFCHDGREGMHLPSVHTKVMNTTGAGDAFMAGMVMGELQGQPMRLAAQWGLKAASLTLQCMEAVNPQMTLEYLSENSEQ